MIGYKKLIIIVNLDGEVIYVASPWRDSRWTDNGDGTWSLHGLPPEPTNIVGIHAMLDEDDRELFTYAGTTVRVDGGGVIGIRERGWRAQFALADLRGVTVRRSELWGANLSYVDLSGANLCGAILHGASLYDTNLRGADLREANLLGACLNRADLSWADLSNASLRLASLHDANLEGANLRGADLHGAVLYSANLCGANLCEVDLNDVDLTGADLCDVVR